MANSRRFFKNTHPNANFNIKNKYKTSTHTEHPIPNLVTVFKGLKFAILLLQLFYNEASLHFSFSETSVVLFFGYCSFYAGKKTKKVNYCPNSNLKFCDKTSGNKR